MWALPKRVGWRRWEPRAVGLDGDPPIIRLGRWLRPKSLHSIK